MFRLFTVCLFLISLLGRADSFEIFLENGKVGIKNQDGKVVLPASFEALGWADGSFSVIGDVTGYRLNNHWGLVNLKKEFITQAFYESLVYGGGEYIIARKKLNPALTKTGCLNLRGETKIDFQYDGIKIHGLRAIVFELRNGNYYHGLTDLENKIVIPLIYKNIYPLGSLRYAVENESDKTALFTETGKPVTGFTIDSISGFRNSKAIIYQNLNQGVLDREGTILVEPVYQKIRIDAEDRVWALPHHEWIVITDRNEIKRTIQAESLQPHAARYIYQYSSQYGLLDTAFTITLPAQYDQLYPVTDTDFIAERNDKQGLISVDKTIKVPFHFDSLNMTHGFIRSWQSTRGWQLMNVQHAYVSDKHYDRINEYHQGFFSVKKAGYWGLLNDRAKETVHCVFDSVLEISGNKVSVQFKGRYGIISTQEEWLVAPQPFPLKLVNDSCFLLFQNELKFVRKFSGEVLYFTDNRLEFEPDHWIEFLRDGSIKTMDYQGTVLSRSTPTLDAAEEIYAAHEGLRGIKQDGKYGFIDMQGRLRIANRYDGVGIFQEGVAPVKLIGKWGFVNAEDKIVINPNYEKVSGFTNGICLVQRNGRAGAINKDGKYVLALQYDSLTRTANQKIKLYLGGRIGLADALGNILIEPRFSLLEELGTGFVLVEQDQKFGVITVTGLPVIPVMYDSLIPDPVHKTFLACRLANWKELIGK